MYWSEIAEIKQLGFKESSSIQGKFFYKMTKDDNTLYDISTKTLCYYNTKTDKVTNVNEVVDIYSFKKSLQKINKDKCLKS